MAARIGFVWTEEGADQRRSGIPTDETVAMAKFKNGMRPVHPGEILREDYLKELGMSANALAKALNVPAPRVNDIVRERRGITADTALRLALYFDSSPQFWLNLQAAYDLRLAEMAAGKKIQREVAVMTRAA